MNRPTYNSEAQSRKNGVARHSGAGATEVARRALSRRPWQRAGEIAAGTGYSAKSIANAIFQLIAKGGAVSRLRDGYRQYALFKDAEKSEKPEVKGEFARAETITIGRGARWGTGG